MSIYELHHYPFAVNLDRCGGSCITTDNLSNTWCAANKFKDVNLKEFNVITWINESKSAEKLISCHCKSRFNIKVYNSNRKWNEDKWWFW